MRLIKIICFKR